MDSNKHLEPFHGLLALKPINFQDFVSGHLTLTYCLRNWEEHHYPV